METNDQDTKSSETGIGAGTGGSATASKPPETQKATGQKRSKERGAHTNNKKNPGKRPHQGGSSA